MPAQRDVNAQRISEHAEGLDLARSVVSNPCTEERSYPSICRSSALLTRAIASSRAAKRVARSASLSDLQHARIAAPDIGRYSGRNSPNCVEGMQLGRSGSSALRSSPRAALLRSQSLLDLWG